MLFRIFVAPYNIPGQKMPKVSPLDVLKMKYAFGEINTTQYNDQKFI
jgi:putative membrane protein